MKFGWSPHVLLLPIPPVLVPIPWWLYQEHQSQLVSPSLSCSTVFSIPFQFYSVIRQDSNVHNFSCSLFFFFFLLLIIIGSGCLAEIRWSVCMLKSHRCLCVSFSRTTAGLYSYHLFLWSNLDFLHNYYYYYYYYFITSFSLRSFYWPLSGSKPRLSKTLLNIRVDLGCAMFWVLAIFFQISSSSSLFDILPSAQIIICMTIAFLFHNFSALRKYLGIYPVFRFFFIFMLWPTGTAKSASGQVVWSIFCHYHSMQVFFKPVLTGGSSLKFEWQQVFSDFRDASK